MTLRLRLTLLYGAVFIVAGASLLAVTYALFKHNQNRPVRAITVSGVNFALPAGVWLSTPAPSRVAAGQGKAHPGSAPVFQRVTPPSAVLRRIRRLGQRQLSTQARVYARRARIAVRTQQSNDASSLLEWSLIAFGVVALLSIGVAWWLSGRALRPLRTMNARARQISAENLHERLDVKPRRDELGELAATFDALLARLERAFESQRRFVANASHELRTPITLERTLAEVALADPDASVESLRRVCERVVVSTEQQEQLLDALLTLARSETGVATGEPVDLATLVQDALTVRESQLSRCRLEARLASAPVLGDRALLERLVANLLDNAIVHNAGKDPWIRLETGEFDGASGLRIANGGERIDPLQVERLFEPFARGGGDRVGARDDGLGLGLSIVRAVVAAHGGHIEARAQPDGGLEFDLRLPATGGRTALDGASLYVAEVDGSSM